MAVIAVAVSAAPARADVIGRNHPNALWRVVHGLCVTDQKLLGLPAPCRRVDLRQGWALVKDSEQRSHLLLVPLRRISGIESPALQERGSPNYWQYAWDQRGEFAALVGKPTPREDIGMAVNSLYGRTQNQLHIHIDCLRPGVVQTLGFQLPFIGPAWSPLRGTVLTGYRARLLLGAELGTRDPFKLLARASSAARSDMTAQTLVVAAVTLRDGRPGFVLMAHEAQLPDWDVAGGEGLLDHSCAVLGGQRRR